jgi:ribosome-binding protein aMBF1 (putative translation factor)
MKEMNGVQPFVYLLTCGCVFTQAGLKTVTTAQSKETSGNGDSATTELEVCPQCATKFSLADDVITINPSQEEEEMLRAKMEHRRLLEPPKKTKKRKNAASPGDPDPPTKKQAVQPSLNPSITAASRAVVSGLAMEEAKRKAGMSEAVKSLYASADGKKRKETFMTMGTFTRVRTIFFISGRG